MEPPPPISNYDYGGDAAKLGFNHFKASSSFPDSSLQKRKWSQVVTHEVIEVAEVEESDEVDAAGDSVSDHKNKQPVGYSKDLHKLEILVDETAGPSAHSPYEAEPSLMDLNSSEDFEFEEYDYEEADYDDDEYDDAPVDHDFNSALAAKFDDLDLPPGVEATVPWLQKQPVGDLLSKNKLVEVTEQIDVKYRAFKQFDTVSEHSDHYFSNLENIKNPMVYQKQSKDWAKRIQHEWKVLEKDLPDTIYVRIYEARMDLLRAVIVGPAGTPYHDGLFFFDIYFPPPYPNSPPMVHYRSGGLRLNPNLYACGKVCLSLLNTWSGRGCEKWNPSNSTMLQVLVSIQALVLNAKPYFNEPGYASSANTPEGEKKSLIYNEETFVLSLRTMLYSLRNPPKHFEDFVAGHFRKYGRTILVSCKAYLNGAEVGSDIEKAVQKANEGHTSHSPVFMSSVTKFFEDLLMEFSVKGADCDDFLAQKVKQGAVKAAEVTSQQ